MFDKRMYQGLKKSIWVAGDTGNGNVRGSQQPRPTTTSTTTPRTYIRPSVRSLGLGGGPPYNSRLGGDSEVIRGSFRAHPDTYRDFVEEEEDDVDGAGAGPWYVYECIPLLKNLAGFEEGSNKNSILTKFIKHMNQNAVGSVQEFIGSDKSCSSGPGT